MQIEFEVLKFRPVTEWKGGGNSVLSSFEVEMFPFRLRGGLIRQRADGSIYASLPGARTCGWTVTAPELLTAIYETALEQWRISNG